MEKIKKLLKKQYVKYGKEGEFSPLLMVAASFDCGGFGVGSVGRDMSVPMERGISIELKKVSCRRWLIKKEGAGFLHALVVTATQ